MGNAIGFNSGLAIDLGVAGPTPNQSPQVSNTGQPNEWQNYPFVTNAFPTASAEWVQDTVTTFPNQTVQIDVYVAPSCSNIGGSPQLRGGGVNEAQAYVRINANGVASF